MRGNFGNMMKQAQAMQANMQKVQAEIANIEVSGESGGGMVKVTMTGKVVVSADGKTRTIKMHGTESNGKKFHNMGTYDRE